MNAGHFTSPSPYSCPCHPSSSLCLPSPHPPSDNSGNDTRALETNGSLIRLSEGVNMGFEENFDCEPHNLPYYSPLIHFSQGNIWKHPLVLVIRCGTSGHNPWAYLLAGRTLRSWLVEHQIYPLESAKYLTPSKTLTRRKLHKPS